MADPVEQAGQELRPAGFDFAGAYSPQAHSGVPERRSLLSDGVKVIWHEVALMTHCVKSGGSMETCFSRATSDRAISCMRGAAARPWSASVGFRTSLLPCSSTSESAELPLLIRRLPFFRLQCSVQQCLRIHNRERS